MTKQPKLETGVITLKIRPGGSALPFDEVQREGEILGQFGICRMPYKESCWTVTHLPTGSGLSNVPIKRKSWAVELLHLAHDFWGDTEVFEIPVRRDEIFAWRKIRDEWADRHNISPIKIEAYTHTD